MNKLKGWYLRRRFARVKNGKNIWKGNKKTVPAPVALDAIGYWGGFFDRVL